MEDLIWPLHILSKAIHFKNLSGASQHVGLSQPQLSRLITKIESELNITLLDRTVRRKSSWTPEAFQIVETYTTHIKGLTSSIEAIKGDSVPTEVTVATLEGLSSIAIQFSKLLFDSLGLQKVTLDVLDQRHIEKKFINNELDFIFTFQSPGKEKKSHFLHLGYQTLDPSKLKGSVNVFSPFEYHAKASQLKKDHQILISNSLLIRRNWLEKFGGEGQLPSKMKKKPQKDSLPVYLFAQETISPTLWQDILKANFNPEY